jgi:PKD repeat protein
MRQILIILGMLLLVGNVSAVVWTNSSGCWTATSADGKNLVMWNATGNFTWVVPVSTPIEVLIIAGGASGGVGNPSTGFGAGGGAGGFLNGTISNLTYGGSINISVGDGGAMPGALKTRGNNGKNSSFWIYTAFGGGGGGSGGCSPGCTNVGINGGCGGGGATPGSATQTNQSPLVGHSSNGGTTSNGIGGGASGTAPTGLASNITDTLTTYATGGTGGSGCTATAESLGNGGNGSWNSPGCDGGSGVVIVRYDPPPPPPISSFTANQTRGVQPLSVQFNDTSVTDITNWSWNFGEGNTSLLQNPTNIFYNGNHFVTLGVTNASGSSLTNASTWINVSPSGGMSGWNRQDIIMDQIFTVIFNVKDSSTHNGISGATVITSNGDNITTDIFGSANISLNYTALAVQFGATGYQSRTITYVVDRDRSETIYLTAQETTNNSAITSVQSYPKYVTFHVKEGWGTAVSDVIITMVPVSTSTGDWDWLASILGVDLDEIPLNNESMSQSTDSLGTATFYVFPTGKYNLTFTKSGYTIPSMILVPRDDHYIIYATGTEQSYYRNGVDELQAVNITITRADVNTSYSYLNLTYYDSTGHTTGGYIDILQKNDTPGGAAILLKRIAVPSSSFTNSTGISHVEQISGYFNTNVTHSDFGNIKRAYPFQLNSVPISFLGFGKEIQLLVALGMVLFTAMLAGATHARQINFVIVIELVFFYTFHWFQAMIDRGVPETSIIIAIGLVAVVAIAANVEVRKKREKY